MSELEDLVKKYNAEKNMRHLAESRASMLEEKFEEARSALQEFEEWKNKVKEPPHTYGVVVSVNEKSVDVSTDARIMELNFVPEVQEKLAPGVCVNLCPETYCVVGTRGSVGAGILTSVEEILDDGRLVISEQGGKHIVNVDSRRYDVEKGDRILIDGSLSVVVENLGKRSTRYEVFEAPVVRWEDIGGLKNVEVTVRNIIERPYLYREVYEKYHKKPVKGLLLYGPNGCGKTLVAKAIGHSLSLRFKKRGDDRRGYFLCLNGPEILDKFVGESESAIRDLFSCARENSRRRGDISVIFIDEAEGLFRKRSAGFMGEVYNTIVQQFLAEMDGMRDNNGVLVVLASNRPDLMDPAVLRPGRIDEKIYIGRPDKSAAADILNIHIRKRPIYSGGKENVSKRALAKKAMDELYGGNYPYFEIEFKDGSSDYIHMRDLVSGAVLMSIAERATDRVIGREIGGRSGKSGLTLEDFYHAIREEYNSNKGIVTFEKEDLINLFLDRYGDIESIVRVRDHDGGDREQRGKNGD